MPSFVSSVSVVGVAVNEPGVSWPTSALADEHVTVNDIVVPAFAKFIVTRRMDPSVSTDCKTPPDTSSVTLPESPRSAPFRPGARMGTQRRQHVHPVRRHSACRGRRRSQGVLEVDDGALLHERMLM